MAADADRNLLFGILALQTDFIRRDALIAGMQAWVQEKSRSLGEVLVQQGALSPSRRALLESLVQEHAGQHGGDLAESLATFAAIPEVRESLNDVEDTDVQSSLAASRSASDPYLTRLAFVDHPHAGRRFKILRFHDKGGLGEVYVARDTELNREVALKQIQERHADDEASRGRFLVEAEITGGLEHPGIVPVYGLGRYEDGRPYYAMRFIKGDSLRHAIDRFHAAGGPGHDTAARRLELRSLLGRFLDVCNAIEYAHSRGVLHRDLKPGNVMLGKYGETLVVDWGLAKITGRPDLPSDDGEVSLRPGFGSGSAPTEMGHRLGTPGFMSPEQASGRLDRISPASDVYGLGATLYCLLAGKPPSEDNAPDVAPPRSVNAEVPRPLDAICRRAMALRPEDRYPSPRALADDVEHWLADEPVSAWSEPATTRLARWGRGHKSAMTSACVLLASALVAASVNATLLGLERGKTRMQKRLAETNLTRALGAMDSMLAQLEAAHLADTPQTAAIWEPLQRRALQLYLEYLKDYRDRLDVRRDAAMAYYRVGTILHGLSRHDEASESLGEAIKLQTSLVTRTPDNARDRHDLALSLSVKGHVLNDRSQSSQAEPLYRESLKLFEELAEADPDKPEYRRGLSHGYLLLGDLLRQTGRVSEAEKAYDRAKVLLDRLLTASPKEPNYLEDLARLSHTLGLLNKNNDRLDASEESLRRAVELQGRLAKDAPAVSRYRRDMSLYHHALALVLEKAKRIREAETFYLRAIGGLRRLVEEFPDTPAHKRNLALTYSNLGAMLLIAGRVDEASEAIRLALDLQERLVLKFPRHPTYLCDLATSLNNMGFRLAETPDRRAEAERILVRAVELIEGLVADYPKTVLYKQKAATFLDSYAVLLRATGRPGNAEEALQKALKYLSGIQADESITTSHSTDRAQILEVLGDLLLEQGRSEEAASSYSRALAILGRVKASNPNTDCEDRIRILEKKIRSTK